LPESTVVDVLGLSAQEPIELRAAQAIAGDADSIRALWTDHRRWIAAILLAHKPRWADVQDLLQEVALAFVKKAHEIRDPRAVKPWLRTVALNAAHAAARSGKVRTWATGTQSAEDGPQTERSLASTDMSVEGLAEMAESSGRLLNLAARLPDGYREPLILKAVRDMSYREIGRIMGLPETTVETRIARARKQLRELAQAEESVSVENNGAGGVQAAHLETSEGRTRD
jgi:RNA polymerase sigma-70 factor (ECF subfamily)